MKLDHLYSLRHHFTVVGLTGRTGSGCTRVAEILSGSFQELDSNGLRSAKDFNDKIFERKYMICKSFLNHGNNWRSFEIIRYVNVLLFFILHKYGGDISKTKELFTKFFKEKSKETTDSISVDNIMQSIVEIHRKYKDIILKIAGLKEFPEIRKDVDREILNDIFFGEEFKELTSEILVTLEKEGYYRSRVMLHWVACNIRSTGEPLGVRENGNEGSSVNVEYIYSIAELINSLIKARRSFNEERPTKIVIDSLRNSLEIMYFKQRFSAFYMVAVKDVLGKSSERLNDRLKLKISDTAKLKETINKLLELDEVEYRTKDFSKGTFSSPDVENCIQKSDYHILNLKKDEIETAYGTEIDGFCTREEQIMKFITLIHQPGLITPGSAERAMQIANTAKLNSGCISRKVGAVITDSNYYVKAIGWNDVPKGHTPCNLRSVTDFLNEENLNDNQHYSNFEKGKTSPVCSYKYKGREPGNFKDALVDYFETDYNSKKDDLNGKNCSFCFKSVHNHYEKTTNQVHTRSLHAEENAMLQLTKLGGMGAEGGYLFTTASPCELCSKKAYQLGIKKIFYIDPYPGIAVDQILHGGTQQPVLIPFSGAIGNAYDWLYESFMAYKDELTMTLEQHEKQQTQQKKG